MRTLWIYIYDPKKYVWVFARWAAQVMDPCIPWSVKAWNELLVHSVNWTIHSLFHIHSTFFFFPFDKFQCPFINLTSFISTNTVKVYEPYLLLKDALKEEECPWLIKSTRQGSLNNVGHFITLPHVWHLWSNTCSTS